MKIQKQTNFTTTDLRIRTLCSLWYVKFDYEMIYFVNMTKSHKSMSVSLNVCIYIVYLYTYMYTCNVYIYNTSKWYHAWHDICTRFVPWCGVYCYKVMIYFTHILQGCCIGPEVPKNWWYNNVWQNTSNKKWAYFWDILKLNFPSCARN